MMQKLLLVVCTLFFTLQLAAQKTTCTDESGDSVQGLNSITKCTVQESNEEGVKTEKISIKVVSRKRILRKRNEASGILTNENQTNHKLASIKKKISEINKGLNVNEIKRKEAVLFNFVEEIPLFESCESSPLAQQEKCFRSELSKHIKRNFRYPEKSYNKGIQGRVFIFFNIDSDGHVVNLKTVDPYLGEELGEEAKRIIKKLPEFKPGKQGGNPIAVKYGLPITFKIPGVKPTNVKKPNIKKDLGVLYTFNRLNEIPRFKACSETNEVKCFNKGLIKHIQENFIYPESAIDDNIEGIVDINFVIDATGKVVNIEAKGGKDSEILEKAAINLVKKLPTFTPAVKDGKKVNAKYSFPLNFSLD